MKIMQAVCVYVQTICEQVVFIPGMQRVLNTMKYINAVYLISNLKGTKSVLQQSHKCLLIKYRTQLWFKTTLITLNNSKTFP
jgi:hypothetical protein